MSEERVHVRRIEGLQWRVESRYGAPDRKYYPNREDAIAAGSAMALAGKAELIVYTRDGRVGRRKSFHDHARNITG